MTTTQGHQSQARIGLVGAGWRAEYFLRIARELPDRFEIARVLVRTAESAASVARAWDVPSTTHLADFLADRYDYVVVSTPPDVARELIEALVSAGVPVLTETPPAVDVAALRSLWTAVGGAPVQVAEQYHLQPHHVARLAVARSGLVGEVSSVRVSTAHGYHGMSLARRALGIGFEPVSVSANTVPDPTLAFRGRNGFFDTLEEVPNERTIALLRFDGEGPRTAVFDFSEQQYWSPARSRHLGIRGTRGEIDDDDVHYLAGPANAVTARLTREATGIDGDLGGSHLVRISLHGDIQYGNRFAPARLNDDELAVAETMHLMARFVVTGEPFYGLAEASHDHYLGQLVQAAATSGTVLHSSPMPWQEAGL
ncbi:putative dehydrogenase [Conyzicola lurida]|uniref:Putative dehydrogenase n=1 Tax=Conyzicola lurida TaxID=1172621 RepID=A0A841AHQ8_9MICO|nr:Gfo/Idh/MocA family oxidoreductase [Conyzicola lurida]MBB5842767.1 putative dehydrogenase [Conyzicola lurida]